jgi:ATP-dependent DNA ligase
MARGFRMAARIERGKAKLLTRTGLDWSANYPSLLTALAAVRGGVRLVFYAFDLLHLDQQRLPLHKRKSRSVAAVKLHLVKRPLWGRFNKLR